METKIYKTNIRHLSGTDYSEVSSKAKFLYKIISSRTKRRPYIRSAFFKKEKIFLDYFWGHIMSKNQNDRLRRLKQYSCGLDLIKNSKISPISKISTERQSEILHRFYGLNGNNELFVVQIKENIKNKEKCFISVFPQD